MVCDDYFVLEGHNVGVAEPEVRSDSTLPVQAVDGNFEIVVVLPSVDHEPWLILSVSHSEAHSWPEHHLTTPHEVVHHILEFWYVCLLVNQVKVYLLLANDLDTDVTLDEVDLTASVR